MIAVGIRVILSRTRCMVLQNHKHSINLYVKGSERLRSDMYPGNAEVIKNSQKKLNPCALIH